MSDGPDLERDRMPVDGIADGAAPEHLHWTCARVGGPRVLAVGHAAAAALPLAREGHVVTWLHDEQATLDAARRAVGAEQPSTGERLELQLGEAGSLPFDDDGFDAVVIGDLLDRQLSRARPLAEASRVLRDGGRLILTVAYGVRQDPERPPPMSLDDLIGELGTYGLALTEVDLVADRVCAVAVLEERADSGVWRQALEVAELRVREQVEMLDALAAGAAEARAGEERARRRGAQDAELADARAARVASLEAALAAATHERDAARGAERVARAGVDRLERAIEAQLLEEEASLTVAELRAEDLERSLEAMRSSRVYRLTRFSWRLRKLLKRG